MGFTRQRWEALSEKERWDIMVALRGPDSHYGETLKWYTTSVIRGQMRGILRVGGTINTHLQMIITPRDRGTSFKSKPKIDRWNCAHFIEHVQLAAHHMGLHDMQISGDLWHEAMCMSSAYEAGKKMLEVLSTGAEFDPVGIKELGKHVEMGRVLS